jgi:RecJ-like exonuclease
MAGGEHSSVELTVAVKVPCQECGGRGYVETVTGGGRIVGDTTARATEVSTQARSKSPRAAKLAVLEDWKVEDHDEHRATPHGNSRRTTAGGDAPRR